MGKESKPLKSHNPLLFFVTRLQAAAEHWSSHLASEVPLKHPWPWPYLHTTYIHKIHIFRVLGVFTVGEIG